MIIIDTLVTLEDLCSGSAIPAAIKEYVTPTLEILETEDPDRDPHLEGGLFIFHQALRDLTHSTYGLLVGGPKERPRLPVPETIEKIDSPAGSFFAAFVLIDDAMGNTHLLPDAPWLPADVRVWLETGLVTFGQDLLAESSDV